MRVSFAEERPQQQVRLAEEKSSFKKIKKQRLFERINKSDSWNSTFLNPNTILEKMAEHLGMSKKEMLDAEIDNPAMVQSLVEKELLDRIRVFFEQNGMNFEAFSEDIKST